MSTRKSPIDGRFDHLIKSQYDLLLFMLPIPLLCGILTSVITAVPFSVGVGTGGVPSIILLAYGLFINDPHI